MNKSKSLKSAVVALVIFTLIVFVAWVVFFLVLGVFDGLIPSHIVQVLTMFAPWKLSMNYYLPSSIGTLSIVFYVLLTFVLMMVFSIVKRRGIMVFPWLLVLITAFALIEHVANMSRYTLLVTDTPVGYLHYITGNVDISKKIMAIAIMITAYLGFVLSFLAFLLAMIHTCKYPKTRRPQVDAKLDETRVEAEAAPADVNGFLEEPEPEKPLINDQASLVLMIKDIIREELKDVRSQPSNVNTVTGANFSAPLVVQYFNGTTPAAQPQVEEKKPEPEPEAKPEEKFDETFPEEVVEPELIRDIEEPIPEPEPEPQPEPEPEPQPEPQPDPEPEPEPEPEPQPEPEPVVEEPAPEPEPVVEKPKIIRIPFEERITSADKDMKNNYNELKNDIMAYGVKSRVSNSGDTFRLHRKTYVKLTIAGKSLKLYFALNPDDYKDTTLPIQDASEKGIYAEIPLVFKVKSGLSMRRAKQLIADTMAQDGLVQGEIGKVNWVKEIAAMMKENRKASSDDDDE